MVRDLFSISQVQTQILITALCCRAWSLGKTMPSKSLLPRSSLQLEREVPRSGKGRRRLLGGQGKREVQVSCPPTGWVSTEVIAVSPRDQKRETRRETPEGSGSPPAHAASQLLSTRTSSSLSSFPVFSSPRRFKL